MVGWLSVRQLIKMQVNMKITVDLNIRFFTLFYVRIYRQE